MGDNSTDHKQTATHLVASAHAGRDEGASWGWMKSKRNAHYLEGPVRASKSRIVSQVGNSFRPVLPSAQSAPRREKLGLVNATSSVARAVRGCASWTSHLLSPLACRKPIAKMWIFVVAPPTTHASNHVKAENLEGDIGQDVQIPSRRIPRGLSQFATDRRPAM